MYPFHNQWITDRWKHHASECKNARMVQCSTHHCSLALDALFIGHWSIVHLRMKHASFIWSVNWKGKPWRNKKQSSLYRQTISSLRKQYSSDSKWCLLFFSRINNPLVSPSLWEVMEEVHGDSCCMEKGERLSWVFPLFCVKCWLDYLVLYQFCMM